MSLEPRQMAGKKARGSGGSKERPRKRAREAAAPAGDGGGGDGDVRALPVVTDARFAALQWDPRFSRVPKKTAKQPVDDRFKAALVSNPAFRGSSARVDRFGRVKGAVGKDAALRRLYDLGSSDEEEHEADEDSAEEGRRVGNFVEGSEGDAEKVGDEGDSGVESAESDEEDEADEEERREVIVRGEATRRLAVIGLDWSNARAVDIFVSLQSFCPAGKVLKCVKVHPSKFGMERLAVEAKLGPQVLQPMDKAVVDGLMNGAPGEAGGVEDAAGERRGSNDAGAESDGNAVVEKAPEDGVGEGDEEGGAVGGEDADESGSESSSSSRDSDESDDGDAGGVMETSLEVESRKQAEQSKMRRYEEDRLKYYYAVAEFEDVGAADAVYEQCDGVEFETTGLAFDLRFVPDGMEIDAPVRDEATCVPDSYAPPILAPSTLNNCKVKLSWDADAPDRAVLKKRTVGRHDEDEENLKAYLASASESEDGNDGNAAGNAAKKKELEHKRWLLLGGDGSGDEDKPNDEEMEMEVTFEPGLQEKGDNIVKRKEARESCAVESEWEARLRRMQERKAEKRKARKDHNAKQPGKGSSDGGQGSEGSEDGLYGDVVDNPRFGDDPFFSTAFSDEDGDEQTKGKESLKLAKSSKDKARKEKNVKSKRSSKVTGASSEDEGALGEDEHDAEDVRRKANLELVMMADDRKKGATSLRNCLMDADSDDDGAGDAQLKKKNKRARGRRRSDREAAEAAAARDVPASAMDVGDKRFASLFSSHMFAMDPTHPKFKRNSTTEQILKEKARRGGSTAPSAAAASAMPSNAVAAGGAGMSGDGKLGGRGSGGDRGDGEDVMDLVASIKSRASTKRKSLGGRKAKGRP